MTMLMVVLMSEYNPDKAYKEHVEKGKVTFGGDMTDEEVTMVRALEGLLGPKGYRGILLAHDDNAENGIVCTYPSNLGPTYVALRGLDVGVAMLECALETGDIDDNQPIEIYELVLELGERLVASIEEIHEKLGVNDDKVQE